MPVPPLTITLRFSFLAVLLAIDLLLLPMFHPGGLPFKLTFALLALWALSMMSTTSVAPSGSLGRTNRFIMIAFPILGMAMAGILGQLYVSVYQDIVDPLEGARSVLIYVLIVLALGFGQSACGFDLKWLIKILYAAVVANFLFVFAGTNLPWLTHFYYDEAVAEEILGFARPRGLFGNPNATMLLVNMPLLFIVVANRLGYMRGVAKSHYVFVVVLVLSLAFVLGSRTEFLNTIILSGAMMFSPTFQRAAKIRGAIVMVVGTTVVLALLIQLRDSSYAFVDQTVSRFQNIKLFDLEHDSAATILRPLIMWEAFRDRFAASPLFGTGFSVTGYPPLEVSPLHFHNDWFRVLATSGLLGGLLALFLVMQIGKKLHWLLLLPFFLPGLTNTFVLNIPAVMFYFFMIGVLLERRAREGMHDCDVVDGTNVERKMRREPRA